MSSDRSDSILPPAQTSSQVRGSPPTLPGFTCGLDATLRFIAGKWKPLILYFLAHDGPTRYGELQRAVRDVSHKMLIQQLKELEADGLVKRTDYKEIPPRVDYSLTPLGLSLAKAVMKVHGGRLDLAPGDPGLVVSMVFPEARAEKGDQ